MAQCKHGMELKFCAWCTAPKMTVRSAPKAGTEATPPPRTLPQPPPFSRQFHGTIRVVKPKRGDPSLDQLDEDTRFVHIDGYPYAWAIRRVLDRAPHVATIEVTPRLSLALGPAVQRLCEKRGVRLATGLLRPDVAHAWDKRREHEPHALVSLRAMVLALGDEEQQSLQELLVLGCEEASIMTRYLCLNGERYVPQRVLAEELGYSTKSGGSPLLSLKIRAVLRYLNVIPPTQGEAHEYALRIRRKVVRLHERLAQFHRRTLAQEEVRALLAQTAEKLGLQGIPEGLPAMRLETFEEILRASRDGRLEKLRVRKVQDWEVIMLRFGLQDQGLQDQRYRTLQEIANLMGVTYERVRQREERSLKFLGIQKDT